MSAATLSVSAMILSHLLQNHHFGETIKPIASQPMSYGTFIHYRPAPRR